MLHRWQKLNPGRFSNTSNRVLIQIIRQDIFQACHECWYQNLEESFLLKLISAKLPGVGRKSANVVASVIFNKPVMAVDTHVFRVSNRIGLVKNAKTPLSVEIQLTRHIPVELIHEAHHWLILHGRYTCTARNPLCSKCGLSDFCVYYRKSRKRRNR